jgi:hypothetical protein
MDYLWHIRIVWQGNYVGRMDVVYGKTYICILRSYNVHHEIIKPFIIYSMGN